MLRSACPTSLVAALFGATVIAQEGTPPPLPAPGRLIDVGGWRLHLNCTGPARGSAPTVILEPGIGAFSVEWSLVQPLVARQVRVCSYDRAGDGWSELGPHPRTFKQIVYELHTLLERAREKPPFVLVGQSYGGWLVRQYQLGYPTEVAGMVLVDAGEDDPERIAPDGTVTRSSTLVSGTPIPPIQTSGPLRVADIPPAALAAMRKAIAATRDRANDPPRDKLPEDARRMRAWAQSQLGHLAAGVNPIEIEELALLRAASTATPRIYGDMPLVVITRGHPDSDDTPERIATRLASHKAIADRSRNGRHVIAEKSGHHVQIDQPDLVANVIQDVVSVVRK
jgi:pimeloyl-ACP methyl ester carboxylesterase